VDNPPNVGGLPRTLEHVRHYALDMAYIAPTHANESRHKFRRRIYETIRSMHSNVERSDEMRIVRQYPQVNWQRLWANLHTAGISDEQTSIWFTVIHDLIPTENRLATIHLADTNQCNSCGDDDTLQHRLTQCGVSKMIRCCTRERIAEITDTTPLDVPEEWVLRPDFHLRPPQSHKAVVWWLAQLVTYQIRGQRSISPFRLHGFYASSTIEGSPRSTGPPSFSA